MNNSDREILSPKRKALLINLDESIFGSFAEIGGGQEVARSFFQAGGASGTIAKTICAYDMVFSDNLYGESSSGRYVSETRLNKMLETEYNNLIEVLGRQRGESTRFFVFANTVATLNFKKNNEGHGWIGLRYQLNPLALPNDVVLHVRLLENDNLLQQTTLGILGVNLIYACFNLYNYPNSFLKSLLDSISDDRIEIDMVRMSGPDLSYVDNRLLAVQLVKNRMTNVTMFDRYGVVKQPSDLLYKKNIMVLRGSFRPITYVGFDMLKAGFSLFKKDVGFDKEQTLVLCEMTMNNLLCEGEFDERDFLDRVDILCGMGQNVMISSFREFYKLAHYFSRFRLGQIRMVMGAQTLINVLDEKFYESLKGGILEAFGKLFIKNLKLYIYPSQENKGDEIITSSNIPVKDSLRLLYRHLAENGYILDIPNYREEILPFFSYLVLKKMKENNPEWENMVPKYVSEFIKRKKLFEYEG